jgi:hypothetical protein
MVSHSFSPAKAGLPDFALFKVRKSGKPDLRGEKGGMRGFGRCDTEMPEPPHPTLSPPGRGSEMQCQ